MKDEQVKQTFRLDIKKVITAPKNQYESVTALVKLEQQLIDAIHIMHSIMENPDEMEFHVKRINQFLEPFNS